MITHTGMLVLRSLIVRLSKIYLKSMCITIKDSKCFWK